VANQEELAILKQGADFWNKWREGRLVTENDLNKADLNGSNLKRCLS
jgi:hypothetical protein